MSVVQVRMSANGRSNFICWIVSVSPFMRRKVSPGLMRAAMASPPQINAFTASATTGSYVGPALCDGPRSSIAALNVAELCGAASCVHTTGSSGSVMPTVNTEREGSTFADVTMRCVSR